MSALVAGQGDALRILLDGAVDDLAHRTVVAQVDDFGPGRLQQPAHDVDGGVVPVEQGRGRHQAHVVDGTVRLDAGSSGGGRRRGHRDLPDRGTAPKRRVRSAGESQYQPGEHP